MIRPRSLLRDAWRRVRAAAGARFGRADVAFFVDLLPPPWGGGNQFLLALAGALERAGVAVGTNYVGPRTRAVLINSMSVDEPLLARCLRPGVRVVHRVDGPISVYRGSGDEVDRDIARLNARFAHATILQSQYSLREHERLGIAFAAPEVIPNAPDPRIFHPPRARAPRSGPLRVIATAWSDNPNKGGETYRWLDAHLDPAKVELTFAGRIGVPLARARVLPPLPSASLAGELRRHDVYLTASLHDPCSNALLEALACGLPAVFARSGGHPELVGDAGLGFERAEEIPALLERIGADADAFRAKIRVPALDDVAARYRRALLGD